jgi:hypothetical protein
MDRRSFIKKTVAAGAGAMVVPYILPSGRLFAATGSRLANHVVYVLFAGGVRQQESILQRYLDDSQDVPIQGNIMYNILNGAAPSAKIVYGTDIPNQPDGSAPIPKILNQTLESQGTLFKEVRSTTTGHYPGLNTLVTGNTGTTQGLRQKPIYPTVFEYLRKHGGLSATDCWFVGNGIGNSTPLLDFSEHPDYGAQYGANFLCPTVAFGQDGIEHLSNAKIYHPEEELDPMYKMKYFLDNSFRSNGGLPVPNVGNTEEEKQQIKSFFNQMFQQQAAGNIAHPPVADNPDLRTVGWACEVMKEFEPAVTVINLSNVDGCHSNFTGYLRNLHRADHAVGHIWNYIQNNIPGMAGDTIMIVTPEHGRNTNPNPIFDENDWYAYDHSDQNSLRVFTSMVGPNVQSNLQIGSETNPIGTTMDNVLTIGEILGVKQDMLASGNLSGMAMSLFDRI